MIKNYYYYIIIGLVFFYNCEDPLIETQLGTGGHQLLSYYSSNATFKTIQFPNKIGNSSNLYVGKIDGKESFAIIKIKSDIFAGSENICNNENIDSITVDLKLSYDPLYSSLQPSLILDSLLYNQNHIDNNNIENYENQLNAYLVMQSKLNFSWLEDASLDYNETDSLFIIDNYSLHFDSLRSNLLPLTIGESNISVHLDSIINDNSIIDLLCSGEDENSLIILLEYKGEKNIVIESANSPYTQPYLEISYKEKEFIYQPYNKIEIIGINNNFNIDSIYIQTDSEFDEFGTVLGFGSITDTNNIIDSQNLNNKIDLFDIILSPNFHENDSSNLITLSLQDIHLVYRNYDPAGDDFDSLFNIDGTENNLVWDFGELFFDCGADGICNEEEEGFNPNGTEKNGLYDLGEIFLDYGTDGIPDSLEADSLKEIDNYNPDPNADDYNEELNNLGTENNNLCDIGEVYLDFGIDGIPDSLEGINYEHDNYDPVNNPTGTEKNNIWDEGEWFKDTGIDGLWNIDEPGYNLGTEGNGVYDFGESFYDFGIDGIPDSLEENITFDNFIDDPNDDDWRDCGVDQCCDQYEDGYGGCLNSINPEYIDGSDLNGDNFNQDLNENGTENNFVWDYGEKWEGNNLIDWYDSNEDSLYNLIEIDSGEVWYDWGIDQVLNQNETYFGSFPLSYSVGDNSYIIDNTQLDIDTIFIQPDTTDIYDANLWISRIIKDNNNIALTISINTTKEIAAIQFKLDHLRFFNIDTLFNINSTNLNYINSLRIIEDFSIYNQRNNTISDSIYVNYSESFSALIDFPDIQLFIEENPNVIISNAFITLYPDSIITNDEDYFRLYLNRILDNHYNDQIYIDSLANQFILDYPYYYSYLATPDSIQFNVKRYIQKLVANEYEYNGLLLSTDGLGYNFDYFYFKNLNDFPIKLDILYSK